MPFLFPAVQKTFFLIEKQFEIQQLSILAKKIIKLNFYSKKCCIFAISKAREFSSAGLEHLPYKQRVNGSNPLTPTLKKTELFGLFFYLF